MGSMVKQPIVCGHTLERLPDGRFSLQDAYQKLAEKERTPEAFFEDSRTKNMLALCEEQDLEEDYIKVEDDYHVTDTIFACYLMWCSPEAFNELARALARATVIEGAKDAPVDTGH